MKLEDQIKETLMKHAEDVRPDAGSWNGVETKVRRSHHARVTMVSSLAVALIAVGAIVIPRLGTETASNKNGLIGSSPSASASPEPLPPISGDQHVGANLGFSVVIPSGWRSAKYEGVYEYGPPGFPSIERGGDTFAITVDLLHGPYSNFASNAIEQGAASSTGNSDVTVNSMPEITIDGMKASYVEMNNKPTHQSWYFIEWKSCPVQPPEGCSATEQNTLQVHISASNETLWNKYSAVADRIAYGIKAYDGSDPAHLSNDGSGSENDAYRAALIRFLDARVEGFGAEDFMSSDAQTQAPDPSNCFDLYEQRDTHKRWTSYEILSRIPRGAGAQFTAAMHTDANTRGFIETINVVPNSQAHYQVVSVNGCGVP